MTYHWSQSGFERKSSVVTSALRVRSCLIRSDVDPIVLLPA
jgi:hypothetical protein